MKRITYLFLLLSIGLFFSCEKSEFEPLNFDREFALLTVQVIDGSAQSTYQCGGAEVYQNITVSLYLTPEDRIHQLNPVASKLTLSRGAVTFTKLKGATYYVALEGQDIEAQRTVKIRDGEVKSMRVAVNPSPDVG